jgi:hypothetical protein
LCDGAEYGILLVNLKRETNMFWSSNLVPDETADWISETFGWFIATLDPTVFFDETPLILPTRDFFDAPGGNSHATAESVFAQVAKHMGMADWPCRLIRQADDPDTHVGIALMVKDAPGGPGGTYREGGGEIEITYNPGLMSSPVAFINMLSHELSHYLLSPHVEDIPGGEELHELATDLAAIYAGFGVIQLEGGMIAEGYQGAFEMGWRIGNVGYLSSEGRAYALALFLAVKDLDIGLAAPHLSSDRLSLLKQGVKMLRRQPERVTALKNLARDTPPA